MNEKKKVDKKALLSLAGFVIVFVAFAILTRGRSLVKTNLITVFNQAFFIMLAGMGATFVYAHGGIDLSIGALQGICVFVAVRLMIDVNLFVGAAAAILLGATSGAFLGAVSTYAQIPVFIAGLSLQYVWKGLLKLATAKETISIPVGYTWIDTWVIKILILLIVFSVVYYLFTYTRFGRYIKAIGGSSEVARLSGVNPERYIILSYVVLGICVGIAAVLSGIRAGGVSPNSGSGLEMDVLIAIVLGGMPLGGGASARVTCGVIGALTIVVIENGFVLLGADPNLVGGIKGIIFIITVFITFARKKDQVVN